MATGSVRWLLLDVGGVLELVDDAAWPGRFRDRWAAEAGLTPEQAQQRIAAADLPDTRTASGNADAFWTGWADALGIPRRRRAAMLADFWDAYCGTRDDELFGVLEGVRDRVRLAILSNSGDGAREEEERRYGFSAMFDPVLYSHEIGVEKPDPRAFTIALERLDARPDEVLFIDDLPRNVEAARALGLHAHLHAGTAATIARIHEALHR